MPEQQLEAEAASAKDLRHLEETLQKLWEKARRVSDLLIHLKQENKNLRSKVSELETSGERLTSMLQQKDQEFQRVRTEFLKLQSNGSDIFTKEEREALKTRIKELIAKINSRL